MRIKNKERRTYYIRILIVYAAACAFVLGAAFHDIHTMVIEYNAKQAQMITELLVENVDVALKNSVQLIEEVGQVILNRDTDAKLKRLDLIEYQKKSLFQSVGMISPDGLFYGNYGDKQDLVKMGFLNDAKNAKETYITDPYRSTITASHVITIFVPVYIDDEWQGTVYANYSLGQLQEYAKLNEMRDLASIYLVNSQSLNYISCTNAGDSIIGSWNNLMMRHKNMEFDNENMYTRYLEQLRSGVEYGTINYKMDGISYTQGYHQIDNMENWYLAIEIANETLSDEFNQFRSKLMRYAGILLVMTGLLALWLIAKEIKQRKDFQKMSKIDAMTGLYNKKAFQNLVYEYMHLAGKKHLGALIFVDVDDFKHYNDSYGHLNGDIVLKKFAAEMQSIFSNIGFVGRYGGDEFIIFIEDMIDKSRIDQMMCELRVQLDHVELEEYGEVKLSFSAGGAVFPQDADDFEELCHCADQAVYRVKEDGKGRFYWYSE